VVRGFGWLFALEKERHIRCKTKGGRDEKVQQNSIKQQFIPCRNPQKHREVPYKGEKKSGHEKSSKNANLADGRGNFSSPQPTLKGRPKRTFEKTSKENIVRGEGGGLG